MIQQELSGSANAQGNCPPECLPQHSAVATNLTQCESSLLGCIVTHAGDINKGQLPAAASQLVKLFLNFTRQGDGR